jgi:Tol biopolymer transport system component
MHTLEAFIFRSWTILLCALVALLTGGAAAQADGSLAGSIELVSRVDPGAAETTGSGTGFTFGQSPLPSIDRDGRYVAFLSTASNLVPGQVDLNATGGGASKDVFLYDRVARTTALVSHAVDSTMTTGDGESRNPVISADGRWVAFASQSSNLVDGLEDAVPQFRLYLYDRVSTAVTLVSTSPAIEAAGCTGCGVIVPAQLSADGRFVAFLSGAPDLVPGLPDGIFAYHVFLYDRTTGQTTLVNGGTSSNLSLSADGRFVAFDSLSDTSEVGTGDVDLYDRVTRAVTHVGPGSNPTISADGGSITFFSASTRVIPGQIDANGTALDLFLYSRASRTTVLISHAAGKPTTTANAGSDLRDSGEAFFDLLLSADGRFVAFLSKATNLVPRQGGGAGPALFLYDRASGTAILASRSPGSSKKAPFPLAEGLSDDGRFLLFNSSGSLLFDRKTGKTSAFAGGTAGPAVISADGSQIAFYSFAANLVPGERDANGIEDLFLHNVAQGTDTLVTAHAPGLASVTPDTESSLDGVSADGRWVLFEGRAVNLAAGQTGSNGQSNVFLYDHVTHQVTLVSHKAGAPATAGDGASSGGVLSADGRYVAFTSYATNLDATVTDFVMPATGKRLADVFLFDRVTGKIIALSRSIRDPGATGNGESLRPVISADGRWIAFVSKARNLTLPGAAVGDVYFYDRVAGALTRTGAFITTALGQIPPTLTPDGRYLAYLSPGPGAFVNVYLLDRVTGFSTLVSHGPLGETASAAPFQTLGLSADGRFVVFTSLDPDLGGVHGGDLNVYLFDRVTGGINLLLPSFSTVAGTTVGLGDRHPSVSADGRWITFLSNDNPTGRDQVVLYDRVAGTATAVTAGQGTAASPTITPDGGKIVFSDDAPDLLPDLAGAVDRIYEYDRDAAALSLIAPGTGSPLPSADGRAVAFESTTPLAPHDFNGRQDVYLFTRTP